MDLPAEPRMRWMLRASARLHAGEAEPVSSLVLPNAEYFPHPFDRSHAAVERLLQRIVGHPDLSEVAVELAVPDGETGASRAPLARAALARRLLL